MQRATTQAIYSGQPLKPYAAVIQGIYICSGQPLRPYEAVNRSNMKLKHIGSNLCSVLQLYISDGGCSGTNTLHLTSVHAMVSHTAAPAHVRKGMHSSEAFACCSNALFLYLRKFWAKKVQGRDLSAPHSAEPFCVLQPCTILVLADVLGHQSSRSWLQRSTTSTCSYGAMDVRSYPIYSTHL